MANSLAAVGQGATHVQGTMNGYGERCGNANLVSIIPSLQLKLGYECVSDQELASLTPAAHFLDELLNFTPDPDQPYVGRNAFAHKGGMHVAGVNVDPSTFEHVDPTVVGNTRELLVSELSGKGTVHARAADAGIELDDASAARVIERVKDLEHMGYHYEAADGSFELLLRKETGEYEPLFVLESWRVIAEKRADGRVETEATIKIWTPPGPDGERYVRTAEGNGPVNALDKALRDALVEIHPHLARHRSGQLQGTYPRRGEGHRRGYPGAARLLRRRRGVGHDRRLGERHRSLVGGARRLARVRHARGSPPPARNGDPRRPIVTAGGDPAGAPRARRRRGAARARGPALRPALARARSVRSSSARSPPGPAPPMPAPSPAGRPDCTWRSAAVGVSDGAEVVTSPFSFVASANVAVYERATARFRRYRPGDPEPRSRRCRCRDDRAHRGDPPGARVRLSGRHPRLRAPRPADRRGRVRGARRSPSRRAERSAPAGIRRCSASTPTNS